MLALLVGCALMAAAPRARADYRTDFRNGVRAFDRKNWDVAIASMQSAIRDKGAESDERILISGTRYVAYTPHLFLAAALSRRQRCDEARHELAASESQGIGPGADSGMFRQVRNDCGSAPPPALLAQKNDTPAAPARTPPPPASTVAESKSAAPIAAAPVAAPQQQAAAATAPQTIAPKTGPPAPPATDTASAQLLAMRHALDSSVADAQKLLGGATPPHGVQARTALAASVADAMRVTRSGDARALASAARTLERAAAGYRVAMRDITPAPTASPSLAGLVEAVRAYVRGDYAKTVSLLSVPASGDRVYRAQLLLFRGSARYAQYVLAGERDAHLRQLLLDDLRESRRLDPARAPDPRLFSPRVRALVASIDR